MLLRHALDHIRPARGATSIIAAFMPGGDMESISGGWYGDEGLPYAREQLDKYEKAQAEAKSDAAYWGYSGDVSYWRAVVALLMAAKITGPDNLPDIPFPDRTGPVMDVQYRQEQWGLAVYKAAGADND